MNSTPPTSPTDVASASMLSNAKRFIAPFIALTIFGLAISFIHGEVKNLAWQSVAAQMTAIPLLSIALAALFGCLSYTTLTLHDTMAVRYLGKALAYPKIAKTAFMAVAVGHNVGASAITGGAIRLRLYSGYGFSTFDVAKIILFCSTTFICGAALPLGLALLLLPNDVTAILHLPDFLRSALSTALIAIPLLYLYLAVSKSRTLNWKGRQITMPTGRLAAGQLLAGGIDLVFACCCLYALLEPQLSIGFLAFLGIYLIAILSGIFSSVPGGVGVFEAVLLFALPDVDKEALLGTILVYRLVYYLLPFGMALLMLTWHEGRAQGLGASRAVK